MDRFFSLTSLSLLLASFSGCAYTGNLVGNFYRPHTGAGGKVLPYSIALVASEAVKNQTVTVVGGMAYVTMNMHPAFLQAIENELRGHFRQVTVIEPGAQTDLFDFVVVPTAELPGKVSLEFQNPHSLAFRRYTDNRDIVIRDSRWQDAGPYMIGLSLCALTPLVAPLMTARQVITLRTQMKEAISVHLHAIGQQIQMSPPVRTQLVQKPHD